MRSGTALSIGSFDGVHLGHRAILETLTTEARTRALPRLLYTFTTPARWSGRSDQERHLLLPLDARTELLQSFSDRVIAVSVDTVRSMTPREFAESVLVGQLQARLVVEGEGFRFGTHRSGDMSTLRSLGDALGFEVISVPSVSVEDIPVSSTRIRQAVREGDLPMARRCLGRPHLLLGTVHRGDGIGSKIGFPTANLSVDPSVLLPPHGIYLIYAFAGATLADGLMYIGSRPTFRGGTVRYEVHLLDVPPTPLYGEVVEIHLLARLRDDRSFPSIPALREQIAADVALARQAFAEDPHRVERILG